jgi:hypothetical protein
MEGYIVLKGRSGLEYYDQNGKGYFIDSEIYAGGEYDYAIYVDSIKSLGGDSPLEDKEIQKIISRVLYLCKERKMRPKVFHDNV